MSLFRFFLVILFFAVGCATSTQKSEIFSEEAYYTSSFMEILKNVKATYQQGKHVEALNQLQGLKDGNLNSNERALKYNFIGVMTFQKGDFIASVDLFKRALEQKSDDVSLVGQINLNLAAAYFKVNKLDLAASTLALVDVVQLKEAEQFKYYHISYLLNPEKRPDSFLYLVKCLGKHKKMEDLRGDSLFETLTLEFDKLNDDEKMRFLYNLDDTPSLVESYLGVYAAEKRFHNGDRPMTQELIEWMKRRFASVPLALEQVNRFEERVLNFAKIDQNSLGIILPLSGEKARFGWRVLNGIDAAIKMGNGPSFSHMYIRNSEGNEALGAHQVQELIKQQNVAIIIGGLFPEEAKEEYLKAKKYGAFFISLSPIYLPKEEKDFLLLEVPGSVESIVHQLISPNLVTKFGKRGAIMFTEDERGRAFMREFVSYAEVSGLVTVHAAESIPKVITDYREPVMKLLGLSFERERLEEWEMMKRIYALDRKSSQRKTHELPAVVDFDWLFLPLFPDVTNQIIPLFGYYDAYHVTVIGGPSWRSQSLGNMSRRVPLYFIGESYSGDLENFKNSFKEKYRSWPQLMEMSAYDAFQISQDILKNSGQNGRNERTEFHHILQQIKQLHGATAQWIYQNGLWIKSMNLLKFGAGKVDVAL